MNRQDKTKPTEFGIIGNHAHTGLSEWDNLALHILYPEDNRDAEFVGATVIRIPA